MEVSSDARGVAFYMHTVGRDGRCGTLSLDLAAGGGGGGRQSGGGVVLSCSAMSCSVTSESLGLFLVTDNVVSLAKT